MLESMNIWKQYITTGNQYYEQNMAQASAAYMQAVLRAEHLLAQGLQTEDAMAALLVSYHNLGDLLITQGKKEAGIACYERALKLLKQALSTEVQGSERHGVLLRGTGQALTALYSVKATADNHAPSVFVEETNIEQCMEGVNHD